LRGEGSDTFLPGVSQYAAPAAKNAIRLRRIAQGAAAAKNAIRLRRIAQTLP
jgi:hypothetical protein